MGEFSPIVRRQERGPGGIFVHSVVFREAGLGHEAIAAVRAELGAHQRFLEAAAA